MREKVAAPLRAFIKRAAFWLLWPAIAVIAWGELAPAQELPPLDLWDKAQHFTAYFGLALMGVLGWAHRRSPLVIFLAVTGLGGALEILQSQVGRDAEWGDMLANTLGAATGTVLAMLLLWLARLVDRRRAD